MKPNYREVSECVSMLAEHRCPRCRWPSGYKIRFDYPEVNKGRLCDFCEKQVRKERKG